MFYKWVLLLTVACAWAFSDIMYSNQTSAGSSIEGQACAVNRRALCLYELVPAPSSDLVPWMVHGNGECSSDSGISLENVGPDYFELCERKGLDGHEEFDNKLHYDNFRTPGALHVFDAVTLDIRQTSMSCSGNTSGLDGANCLLNQGESDFDNFCSSPTCGQSASEGKVHFGSDTAGREELPAAAREGTSWFDMTSLDLLSDYAVDRTGDLLHDDVLWQDDAPCSRPGFGIRHIPLSSSECAPAPPVINAVPVAPVSFVAGRIHRSCAKMLTRTCLDRSYAHSVSYSSPCGILEAVAIDGTDGGNDSATTQSNGGGDSISKVEVHEMLRKQSQQMAAFAKKAMQEMEFKHQNMIRNLFATHAEQLSTLDVKIAENISEREELQRKYSLLKSNYLDLVQRALTSEHVDCSECEDSATPNSQLQHPAGRNSQVHVDGVLCTGGDFCHGYRDGAPHKRTKTRFQNVQVHVDGALPAGGDFCHDSRDGAPHKRTETFSKNVQVQVDGALPAGGDFCNESRDGAPLKRTKTRSKRSNKKRSTTATMPPWHSEVDTPTTTMSRRHSEVDTTSTTTMPGRHSEVVSDFPAKGLTATVYHDFQGDSFVLVSGTSLQHSG